MNPNWLLGSAEILSLPLDVLALEVLRDAITNGEWSTVNWMILAQQDADLRQAPASHALGEAWAWLYSKGLIACDYPRGGPSNGAMFVTRAGHHAAKHGLADVQAAERLGVELHPLIEARVRAQFLMGEHGLAALAAMRKVEIRVRELAQPIPAGQDDFGTKLIGWAFGQGGPLADSAQKAGERAAMRELFSGAIGTFKNPPSHREVDYDDPTEAAEVVLFADLLLRILDRIEARMTTAP